MNNKLKTILITLIVILISAISFGGIYIKNLNAYTNIVKDYTLARNLKGSRVVQLKAPQVEEKQNIDAENAVEENVVVEEEKVEENVSSENLKLSKKILKKRLKNLGSEDYVIEQNSETGDTTIYLEENNLTDNIVGYLTSTGDLKIVDADDENNILMTNEDLKDVKVGYSNAASGTTVYLSIEFNKEGKQKFEEITSNYTKIETKENTEETQNEVLAEETNNENVNEEEAKEKQIKLMIDNNEIMTTSFNEIVSNGILQMSIGSESTNIADVQSNLTQANGMAVLLNSGKMPIEYTLEKNEYVSVDMTQNIRIAVIVLAVLVLIACIVLVIKYKLNGIKLTISFIAMIAIWILLVRYTNVYIAMESSIAFVVLIIVNTYLNWLILRNNKEDKILPSILNTYKQSLKITIPLIIITIILCFINWTPIASIGMLLFWGLISIVITNFAITLPMLNKEK